MRLVLDQDLFAPTSDEEASALTDLFATVRRDPHPHALLTDPPYQRGGQNGPIDVWLSRRDPLEEHAYRGLLETGLFVNAAGPLSGGASDTQTQRRWHLEGAHFIRVKRRASSDWRNRVLTIADAAGLLREPVHLVLENQRIDLAFVRLLAGPTAGTTLRILEDQPGRIVVHGGGGGEAKKWVEALKENPPTPAVWRKLLRAWVVFDKDAGQSDACHLSKSASDFIELCEEVVSIHGAGLSWICLLRREIESYAPDSALLAEATKTQRATFVNHIITWRADPLRAPWAWSLDLKMGLRGDLRDDLPQAVRDSLKVPKNTVPLAANMLKVPFSGLTPSDLSALEHGMGKKCLGKAFLEATPALPWTADLTAEYDRGPSEQAPRLLFVQSLFDRM